MRKKTQNMTRRASCRRGIENAWRRGEAGEARVAATGGGGREERTRGGGRASRGEARLCEFDESEGHRTDRCEAEEEGCVVVKEGVGGDEAEAEAGGVVADELGVAVLGEEGHDRRVVQLVRNGDRHHDVGRLRVAVQPVVQRAADGGRAPAEPRGGAHPRAETGVRDGEDVVRDQVRDQRGASNLAVRHAAHHARSAPPLDAEDEEEDKEEGEVGARDQGGAIKVVAQLPRQEGQEALRQRRRRRRWWLP